MIKARVLAVAAAVALASPAASMPDFLPKPGNVYDEFTALEQPRTDVPVGALWVQGYGPTGEGASADNLETIKSLAGVMIDRDLELRILAGILNMFGLDPSYKNRLSVRLGDLTIVRVKDLDKLSGPKGEPRLYEALRAGTITITTDDNISLDLETRAFGQQLPVTGRSDNGRRRSFTIDGRDMFLSFRVVTAKVVRGTAVGLSLSKPKAVSLGGYRVSTDTEVLSKCLAAATGEPQAESCRGEKSVALVVARASAADDRVSQTNIGQISTSAGQKEPSSVPLPVPVSDGQGGLFSKLMARTAALPRLTARTSKGVASGEIELWLEGSRLTTLDEPTGKGW